MDERHRMDLLQKSEALKSKLAGDVGIIRNSAAFMPRTFSAPDVFEKTEAEEGKYNSIDHIMTEPVLSRINEPFEP